MGRYSPTSQHGSMKLLRTVDLRTEVFRGTPYGLWPGCVALCRFSTGDIFVAAIGSETSTSPGQVYWWVVSVAGAVLSTGILVPTPGRSLEAVSAVAIGNDQCWLATGGNAASLWKLQWKGGALTTVLYLDPATSFPTFGQTYTNTPNFATYLQGIALFSGRAEFSAGGRIVGVRPDGSVFLVVATDTLFPIIAIAEAKGIGIRVLATDGGIFEGDLIDAINGAGVAIIVPADIPIPSGTFGSTGEVFAGDPSPNGFVIQNEDDDKAIDAARASYVRYSLPDGSIYTVRGFGYDEAYDINTGAKQIIPHPDTRADFNVDNIFPDGLSGWSAYSDYGIFFNTSTVFGGKYLYSFAINYNPVDGVFGSNGYHRLDLFNYASPSAVTVDRLTLYDIDPPLDPANFIDDFNFGERAIAATADGLVICGAHRLRDDQARDLDQVILWIVQGPPWPTTSTAVRLAQRHDGLGISPSPRLTLAQTPHAPRVGGKNTYQ